MIKNIYNLLNDFHYDKIFLVTEEMKYLNALNKEFKDKMVFYDSYRMKDLDLLKISYPRKLHRYKLGRKV